MNFKINKWILITNKERIIFDFTNENINEREISLCIEAQFFTI